MRWEAHRPRRASPPTAALGSATRVAPPGLGTARATRWRCRGRAPAAACPATRNETTGCHRAASAGKSGSASSSIGPCGPFATHKRHAARLSSGESARGSPSGRASGGPISAGFATRPSVWRANLGRNDPRPVTVTEPMQTRSESSLRCDARCRERPRGAGPVRDANSVSGLSPPQCAPGRAKGGYGATHSRFLLVERAQRVVQPNTRG